MLKATKTPRAICSHRLIHGLETVITGVHTLAVKCEVSPRRHCRLGHFLYPDAVAVAQPCGVNAAALLVSFGAQQHSSAALKTSVRKTPPLEI